MLGLVAASEFVPDLAEITDDKNKANAVAEAINQKVLLPIREAMKRTYGNEWTSGAATGALYDAARPTAAPRPPEKVMPQAQPGPSAPISPPLRSQITQRKTFENQPRPVIPPAPPSLKAMAGAMPKPPQARKPETL